VRDVLTEKVRNHSELWVVCLGLVFFWQPFAVQWALGQSSDFDIAPFARRCCVQEQRLSQVAFDNSSHPRNAESAADGRYIYGLQWAEQRDIKEVRVDFKAGSVPVKAAIEYWSQYWPDQPPQTPISFDMHEDPWQGEWLKAVTKMNCASSECSYTFQPLEESENPRAKNLPGLDYRRTLKMRLVFPSEPAVESVKVLTGTALEPVQVRIELGAGEHSSYAWSGSLKVYDGRFRDVRLWNGSSGDSAAGQQFRIVTGGSPKGLLVGLDAAKPSLSGSEDITIVTLEAGERTFSFAVPDLDKGPIYVPDFHAYVSLASDRRTFLPSVIKPGAKIREKISKEPEQSYERASSEIPALDTSGVSFPLAVEASWQKFGLDWGGNLSISKTSTRAKGAGELDRLEWRGDRIYWRIGTGAIPNFRRGGKDSELSLLDDNIPVATVKWSTEGIIYTEESFATLLSGPLSPDDPARGEETPAVLMVRLSARNPESRPELAHLWLATDPGENVVYENGDLVAQGLQLVEKHPLVRAHFKLPDSTHAVVSTVGYGGRILYGLHVELPLAPNEERSVFISIPFFPRLSSSERTRLTELNYETERTRVVGYWQDLVTRTASFDIPGDRIAKLAKAIVPHILLSVFKDPKSGLYIVPAGTVWRLSSNEGARQCLMLDELGFPERAQKCLETWVRLQGTSSVPGTFTNQMATYNVGHSDMEYPPLLDGDYTSPGYNLNNGYVLRALAEHYLFTRDQEWLRRTAPSMMRAADWIVEQRKLTEVFDGNEKVPEYGLLPAGRLEDPPTWGHWFGVNAEAVAGMTRLAEVLADSGVPEAQHYAEEAAAYKQDLREAVLRASRLAAVVRLRDNTYVPYVPTRPYQRIRHWGPILPEYYSRYPGKTTLTNFDISPALEVYPGPILLLLRNVFQADEPLVNWVLDDWEDNATMSSSLNLNVHGWVDDKDWFSQGGMVFEPGRNPSPIYLRRNEIPAALRSVYNGFVATYYPELNACIEEFHEWGGPGTIIKTSDESRFVTDFRDLLVREDGDTLWLAAGAPHRWLAPGKKIELRDAPTYFGPVSYRMEATDSEVDARVELPTRNKIRTVWLVVRAPEGRQIRAVEVDGKPWKDFDATAQRIRLPLVARPIQISVHF